YPPRLGPHRAAEAVNLAVTRKRRRVAYGPPRAPPTRRGVTPQRLQDSIYQTYAWEMLIVPTPLGQVSGIEIEGCHRFAGIRYAKPPVGERRFRSPEPVEPWEGVYDGSEFGPTAPQPPAGPAPWNPGGGPEASDEDCLFLNVY